MTKFTTQVGLALVYLTFPALVLGLQLSSSTAKAQIIASGQHIQTATTTNPAKVSTGVSVPLRQVLKQWAKLYSTTIAYDNDLIDNKLVALPAGQGSLEDKLTSVLSPVGLAFKKLHADNYVITPGPETLPRAANVSGTAAAAKVAVATVSGRVTNAKGEGLPGVTVLLKGTSVGTSTNANGNFLLEQVATGSQTLVFSYVGYKSKEVTVAVGNAGTTVDAQLSEDATALEDVVVTGVGNPQKKIESSVAISTISASVIEARAPLNSSDAIKAIPGVFVASSGGDGPGNVRVRGLPNAGGYIFFGVMEDGLPVLPTGFNSTPSVDQYFKVDLTVKDIEAIRGGSAPIVLANTAGAVMNILSYTGAQKPYGKVKFTSGLTQGLYRLDANQGGQLSPKIMYNIGGFYRTDKGIKPAAFQANQGGQLKANLTYDFSSKGYIRVYGKYLNDVTSWLLPGIYSYGDERRGESIANYDLYKQTLIPATYQFDLTLPEGTVRRLDMSDGYHTKLGYGGLLFNYATGNGWNFRNNFRYQYTTFRNTNLQLTAITPFSATRNYYYADNGTQLNGPTGFYATQQVAQLSRTDNQIIDYLNVTKELGKHSLTLGGGLYRYNVTNHEAVTGVINTEIANQPRLLLVGSATAPVITAGANTTIGGHTLYDGATNIFSAYASDQFNLTEKLRIDAGARVDRFDLSGNKAMYAGTSTATTGGKGFTVGSLTPYSDNSTYWSASLAANYRLKDNLAFFARATRTYNAFLISDFIPVDFNANNLKNREVKTGEVGIKFGQGSFSLFSSVAYTTGTNLPLGVGVPNAAGAIVNISAFASSKSFSFETEASLLVAKGLNLRLTTTLQNPTFTDYKVTIPTTARPDIAGQTVDWSGNRPQTTPNVNLQLQGNYDYKHIGLYATGVYLGSFYTTSAQNYKLPGYTEITAGVVGHLLADRVELRVWANNLLDTRALTEGNVRGEQFLDPSTLTQGKYMIGRTILPRSFWTSLSYAFGGK